MSTAADPYPTIPQRLVRGFLALVGVCVLYAASYGTIFVLSYRTDCPHYTSLFRLYAPLWRFARATSTKDLFTAYRTWWIRSCRPAHGYQYAPDFGPKLKV